MASNWPPDDQRQNPNAVEPGGRGDDHASNGNPQGSSTLSSQLTPSPGPGPQVVTQPAKPASSVAIWIDRLGLVIRVVFYIELGLLLCVLPWTPLWTGNNLVMSLPRVREILEMNFVRGIVTGIGLVDVWIGIWEAVRYRENR